jgi:hypothetical protein
MGYDLRFDGRLSIAPALSPERLRYLAAFSRSWRMVREPAGRPPADAERIAVGLPPGPEGGWIVGGASHTESDASEASVTSFRRPPEGQPGLRCCWRPTPDGRVLEWDGCEKFSAYAAWLTYLIETFFAPWGHTLEGSVRWTGEDGAQGTVKVESGAVNDRPDHPEAGIDAEVISWIRCLGGGDIEARILAARRIGCAVHADRRLRAAAVSALAQATDTPEVAKAALETLGEFGEEAAARLSDVVPLLESSDPQVRYWATFALGRMGPAARSARSALERLKTDPEADPRYGAIDAIARLTTPR